MLLAQLWLCTMATIRAANVTRARLVDSGTKGYIWSGNADAMPHLGTPQETGFIYSDGVPSVALVLVTR